jgi:hypothetical protein
VKPFTYTYQGKVYNAFSDHYLVEGYNRYMISSGEINCIIVPSPNPGAGGTTVWIQDSQRGEFIHPNELIQALGEGLHNAEAI